MQPAKIEVASGDSESYYGRSKKIQRAEQKLERAIKKAGTGDWKKMQSADQKAATIDFELVLEIQKSYNRLNKKLQP